MRRVTIIALICLMVPASNVLAGGLATPEPWSNQLLIPAAISAPGANGTFFRSDIRITNQRTDAAQAVTLEWLPLNGGPAAAFITTVEIEPSDTLSADDFVRDVMNRGDLGAILVRGVDAAGQTDPDARIHATSRIWTPQPGLAGTSSQTLSPIPVSNIYGQNVVILGHRRDNQYRTNVGLVNLDGGAHTFLVTVKGETPTLVPEIYTITVPPFALVQFPINGAQQTQLRIDIQEDVVPGQGRLTLWAAYASSIDNISGDGWSTVGVDISE